MERGGDWIHVSVRVDCVAQKRSMIDDGTTTKVVCFEVEITEAKATIPLSIGIH
jgi:hypothetical protein